MASSSKVVAISIIGRSRAICTGENSAGCTTGNKVFENNKQAGRNLEVNFDADYTDKIYRYHMIPEVPVQRGDNLKHLE